MNEYWIDSGETCHQVATKKEFYKAIDAGFMGFILYPNGKTFWIKNTLQFNIKRKNFNSN